MPSFKFMVFVIDRKIDAIAFSVRILDGKPGPKKSKSPKINDALLKFSLDFI